MKTSWTRSLSISILWVGILLFASSGYALDPHRHITQYDMRVYDARSGMPLFSPKKIFQDSKGFLWIGTQEGLMRFDGVRFTVYNKSTHQGLLENFIWDIAEDWNGNIWVGTYGGGVSRFDGATFTTYTTKDGLADNVVRRIIIAKDSTIWLGTERGVSRFRNGSFVNFKKLGTEPLGRVSELCLLDDGGVLTATVDIIGGDSARYIGQGDSIYYFPAICKRRNGDVVAWAHTSGLHVYKNGTFKRFEPRLPYNRNVNRMIEDRSGNLWIATGSGIIRVANGRYDVLTANVMLPLRTSAFGDVIEDKEGNLWFTTEAAIVRLSDNKFLAFGVTEGLEGSFGRAICEDVAGNMWVGLVGENTARLIKDPFIGYSVETIPIPDCIPLYPSSSGSVWFRSFPTFGRIVNGKPAVLMGSPVAPVYAASMFEAPTGELWMGSALGKVERLKNGRHEEFHLVDSSSTHHDESHVVGSVFVTSGGEVLGGTWKRGLYSLIDRAFHRTGVNNGLTALGIHSMHEDADGALWLATDDQGIFRRKNGMYRNVDTKHGLSFNRLFTVLEDDSANLWCSGNQGIFKVSKQQLNDVADGKSDRIVCESFNYLDGMRETECNGRWQPSAWKSRDGRLWFVSMAGVVSIDPNNIHRNVVPPPVYIERAIVNDHEVLLNGDRISLASNQNNLEIRYTAPSFEVPERVRFEYRLEGYDSMWTQVGARRAAFYTNLPHGNYRFVVAAFNNDGLRSQTEAGVAFFIAPHWSQTWWFTALSLLGIVVVVGSVFYTIYRFKLNKALAIERIRTNIATDVHDDIKSSWETISLEAQNAKRTILGMHALDKEESNKLASRFDNIVSLAQEVRDDLRDIIWYVDAKKDTYDDLLGHMKGFAAARLNSAGIDYEFIYPERDAPLSLPIRFRRPVFLIFKEAVTNAQKYSGATRVVVEIELNHGHFFSLTIVDNGNGFDIGRVKKGDGLRNMQKRADEMGAEFSILPNQPKGAIVKLFFHLP